MIWRFFFLIVGFAILVFLRAPDLMEPHIWAEDGPQFIAGWHLLGVSSMWKPYAGYLHLLPRLVAALAGMLPLQFTVLVFATAAMVVSTWLATVLFRCFGAGIGGIVAAASILLASGWQESFGSVTNLQWILAIAMIAVSLRPSTIVRCERWIIIVLAGLSGPFSAILLPFFATLGLHSWRTGARNDSWFIGGVCGLVQLTIIATHGSPPATGSDPAPFWLLLRLLELSLAGSMVPLTAGIGLILSPLFGRCHFERTALLVATACLLMAVSAKFYHDPMIFKTGEVGQRYWYVPAALFLLMPASLLAENGRSKVAGILLLILLVSNMPYELMAREWKWQSDDWQNFVEAARNGPAIYHFPPGWTLSNYMVGN